RSADVEVWILPEYAGFIVGSILACRFVNDVRFGAKHAESMGASRWNIERKPIFRGQVVRDPFSIRRRFRTNVEGDIENLPRNHAHEFALRFGVNLIMEPP